MSAPIGSANGLRAFASRWGVAGEIDTTAMDDLLAAGIAAAAAVDGAEGSGPLLTAVTAPSGSLDGAGRLVASAATVLTTYADELEVQQNRWAAAQVTLDLVAQSRELATPTGAPADEAARIEASPTRAEVAAGLIQRETAGRAEQTAASAAADAATATAVIDLSTIAAQLELLGARTVLAGGSPQPVASAPSIGQVPAGPGPLPFFPPMSLPQWAGPAEIPGWWQGLTPREQQAVLRSHPDWVGRTDGLPAAVRDTANQDLLDQDLLRLDGVLGGLGLSRADVADEEGRDRAAAELARLGWDRADIDAAVGSWSVAAQLATARAAQPDQAVQLVIYEPEGHDGRGRAAISIGDLDSAPSVAVLVPGTTSSVPGYLDSHLTSGLDLVSSNQEAGVDGAVLVYVGYRAPDIGPDMADATLALAGAEVLAADVRAIRIARGDDPNLLLIGHSYGATTLSIALDQHGLEADAVVLAGSPGAGTAFSVDDYAGVDPAHVFTAGESDDPVTYVGGMLGVLGPDPSTVWFGAQRMDTDTSAPFWSAHGTLFGRGGPGLAGLTMLMAGRPQDVRTAPRRLGLLSVFRPIATDAAMVAAGRRAVFTPAVKPIRPGD